MQRYLSKILIFLLVVISFVVPLITNAQVQIENPLKYKSFAELLGAVILFLTKLALGLAPVALVISALYFVFAAGDPEKINTAKKIFFWTFIGLVIIFSAGAFIEFVKWLFPSA